ncbi:GNAT family N-acetyltransferase [Streptomyces shenzhenensis]|uniref:GNAT family N-acetyltransferase n=1 Tax=Streptomyces shenzhenensis TaxID=943815 RepID=UPI00367A6441
MTFTVRTAHTAELDPADLRAVRSLLHDGFAGGFSDADFEHALGGMHALVHGEDGIVAHGSVVMRRARHRGRWLRIGYVEAVVVRPAERRRGLGGQVMGALERVVDRAYDLGALSASEDGALLYGPRGWRTWTGRIHALSPDGIVRLADEEGGLLVRPALAAPPDPDHELVFDWRDGDVL